MGKKVDDLVDVSIDRMNVYMYVCAGANDNVFFVKLVWMCSLLEKNVSFDCNNWQ